MFESFQDLSPNTSNISIVATDAVGNSTTQVWKIDANSTVSNFTYDDDGAMLTRVNNADSTTVDMSSNYTWDSLGRLLSYQQGNTTVSFTYDWQGRRVSLSANVSGNVTTQNFLWDGNQIFERRDGGTGSGNISRKYFGDGVVTVSGNTSTNYFYTKDHLGSIREIVANDGHTVDGRYDYGPWGETNYFDYSGGSAPQPDFGYAGYMQTSFVPGYYFTENRVYDPSTHHWLSRDPIGEAGGLNLYGYAGDDPIDGIDPSGLAKITTNADGSSTVQVSQCEIVILDGHGDNARPHTFQFPAKGCAAGGFIGCGAGGTNSRIPKDNLIPGSPYWSGEVMQDDSFTDALKAMNSGAKSLAKTMCAKCKCKTVTIYHMYAPSGNKLIDFFTSPSNTKDVIDCKKQ